MTTPTANAIGAPSPIWAWTERLDRSFDWSLDWTRRRRVWIAAYQPLQGRVRAILYVGFGGFLGAIARHTAATWVGRATTGSNLPLGTFAVNVVGCFAIGLVAGLADARPIVTNELRLFLVVGVLGGFTTFSAFGFEAFELLRRGFVATAALHAFGQLALGTAAVAVGYLLGSKL